MVRCLGSFVMPQAMASLLLSPLMFSCTCALHVRRHLPTYVSTPTHAHRHKHTRAFIAHVRV